MTRTTLARETDRQDALTDYHAGYDAGDYAGEIKFKWHLFRDGVELDCGCVTFEF